MLTVLNGGEVRNQGLEVVAYGIPVQTNSLKWKTTFTWAKNDNEVLSLPEELTDQQIIGAGGNATIIAKVGEAAIEQWGGQVPADYFDNPNAAYDGTLERIMLQKYFALYFNDYQQWFEYRRRGLPVLPKGEALLNNGMMPVRFRYPVIVQTSNHENYARAISNMGGDDINTKDWREK